MATTTRQEARNGAAKGQGRSVAAGGMKAAKQSFSKYVSRAPTLGDGSNRLLPRYSALESTWCGMVMRPPWLQQFALNFTLPIPCEDVPQVLKQ